jgi:hypothetical protein
MRLRLDRRLAGRALAGGMLVCTTSMAGFSARRRLGASVI